MGGRLLACCVAALLICGFSPLGALMLLPLETRFSPWTQIRGILPASSSWAEASTPNSPLRGVRRQRVGARIVVAAELAYRYPKARLVYVGGNSSLRAANSSEADAAEGIFKNLGIREDRVQLEPKSRNTDENVRFSMQLVNPKPGERWLLVTSASHVPRAMGLFRKAGMTARSLPRRLANERMVRRVQASDRLDRRARFDRHGRARMAGINCLSPNRKDRRTASFPHAAAGQVITVCDTNEPAS